MQSEEGKEEELSKKISPTILSLIKGYKRFKNKYFKNTKSFENLVNSQKPKALVIACCDSRVDPAIITDCDPGDLFVVRNIANLVPPFGSDCNTSAALEFGVKVLEVNDIIVLGHSNCGGIHALMKKQEKKDSSSSVSKWVDIAKPAKKSVLKQDSNSSLEEKIYHCEKKSLLISLNNLKTFPWINKRVLENKLFLHAWYFDLATGAIETYKSSSDKFIPL
jgi:carbonic anhydrase